MFGSKRVRRELSRTSTVESCVFGFFGGPGSVKLPSGLGYGIEGVGIAFGAQESVKVREKLRMCAKNPELMHFIYSAGAPLYAGRSPESSALTARV